MIKGILMKKIYIMVLFFIGTSLYAGNLASYYEKQSHCKAVAGAIVTSYQMKGQRAPSKSYVYQKCMEVPSVNPSMYEVKSNL